jgi:hypothetical protein
MRLVIVAATFAMCLGCGDKETNKDSGPTPDPDGRVAPDTQMPTPDGGSGDSQAPEDDGATGTAQGHCLTKDAVAGDKCTEYEGYAAGDLATLKTTCGAQWGDGACSRTDATGGCKKTEAGTAYTDWYYKNSAGLGTSAEVEQLCKDNSLEYVAP